MDTTSVISDFFKIKKNDPQEQFFPFRIDLYWQWKQNDFGRVAYLAGVSITLKVIISCSQMALIDDTVTNQHDSQVGYLGLQRIKTKKSSQLFRFVSVSNCILGDILKWHSGSNSVMTWSRVPSMSTSVSHHGFHHATTCLKLLEMILFVIALLTELLSCSFSVDQWNYMAPVNTKTVQSTCAGWFI